MRPARTTTRSRRHVVVVALAAATLAGACGGGDDAAEADTATDQPAGATTGAELAVLSIEGFTERLADPDQLVINVHVPYEGEIDGTELFIPYTDIAGHAGLPADLDAPILLYCMSDRMSGIAGDALVEAGYTDVAHLGGGMEAWVDAGRPLRTEGDGVTPLP